MGQIHLGEREITGLARHTGQGQVLSSMMQAFLEVHLLDS